MDLKSEWVLHPPAKINLFLDIGPVRADGYHDIYSVFQTVGLTDKMVIRRSKKEFFLEVTGSGVPAGEDNTVHRAYREFDRLHPQIPPLRVRLEKRIPSQAGLGGGSSDAGTFLRFLWKTFVPRLDIHEVLAIAARVGSDVPFFLYGGTCLVEGRGEKVTPLPELSAKPVLIFHPTVGVSTAEAYRALDQLGHRQQPSISLMLQAVETGDWSGVLEHLYNAFEQVVYPRYPEINKIHQLCKEQGYHRLHLSGSGSNLFLFDNEDHGLDKIRGLIESAIPDLKTTLTTTTGPAE